mmetsp:Transcript_26305/g.37625  ORF Transcript_26305/g.37625 Transcript_26305/m.37625 type:complete len:418 (-) Transcript_26305:316-1569(-)
MEFELNIELPPQLGGIVNPADVPESLLRAETVDDLELQMKIIAGVVPTVDTVFRFLSMIFSRARYSAECNIIAWTFVTRLTADKTLNLTMKNWRGVWVAAIMVAQKMWDDNCLHTSSFASILPSVSKQQLKDVELKFLSLLNFYTHVKSSTYAKNYFDLRSLFAAIMGTDLSWTARPLSLIQGRILEEKSKSRAVSGRSGGGARSSCLSRSLSGPNQPQSVTSSLSRSSSCGTTAAAPVVLGRGDSVRSESSDTTCEDQASVAPGTADPPYMAKYLKSFLKLQEQQSHNGGPLKEEDSDWEDEDSTQPLSSSSAAAIVMPHAVTDDSSNIDTNYSSSVGIWTELARKQCSPALPPRKEMLLPTLNNTPAPRNLTSQSSSLSTRQMTLKLRQGMGSQRTSHRTFEDVTLTSTTRYVLS